MLTREERAALAHVLTVARIHARNLADWRRMYPMQGPDESAQVEASARAVELAADRLETDAAPKVAAPTPVTISRVNDDAPYPVRYVCPECKDPDADILECGDVSAECGGYFEHVKDGQDPAWVNDGESETFWESWSFSHYRCRGCDHQFTTPYDRQQEIDNENEAAGVAQAERDLSGDSGGPSLDEQQDRARRLK